MFSECANPACRAEFDYRQGRLFRFHKAPRDDGAPANTHSVQHLWLCQICATIFRLDYEGGRGVLLKLRFDYGLQAGTGQLVATG
jgi:hypothetical protein